MSEINSGYIIIPNYFYDTVYHELSNDEFHVLTYIVRKTHGFNKDFEYISSNELAEKAKFAKNTAKKYLRILEKKQYITIEKCKEKNFHLCNKITINRYKIFNIDKNEDIGVGQPLTQGRSNGDPGVGQPLTQGWVNPCPTLTIQYNNTNNTKENNKEKSPPKPKPEISEQASQLANIFFESFEKNIIEVKTKPKKIGIEKFDKLLKIYSFDDVVKVIEYAHTNNFWKPIILTINKLFDKFETLKIQSQNQNSYKTKSKVEPIRISAQFEGIPANANREHMPTLEQKNWIRKECGLGPITAEEYKKELDEAFGK